MSASSATKIAGIISLFFIFPAIVACSSPSGNPQSGKKWYTMQNCGSCHGPNGNDGQAVNIAGVDMGFSSFVRKLRKTDAPIMPPFPETKISEQDAADIYAFLQGLNPESSQSK